jgi:hypothetical protein
MKLIASLARPAVPPEFLDLRHEATTVRELPPRLVDPTAEIPFRPPLAGRAASPLLAAKVAASSDSGLLIAHHYAIDLACRCGASPQQLGRAATAAARLGAIYGWLNAVAGSPLIEGARHPDALPGEDLETLDEMVVAELGRAPTSDGGEAAHPLFDGTRFSPASVDLQRHAERDGAIDGLLAGPRLRAVVTGVDADLGNEQLRALERLVEAAHRSEPVTLRQIVRALE